LGFLCESSKTVIVPGGGELEFEIQDMALNRVQAMGMKEDFQAVFTSKLRRVESPLGDFSVGDFSVLETPGIYRVVLTSTQEPSYKECNSVRRGCPQTRSQGKDPVGLPLGNGCGNESRR